MNRGTDNFALVTGASGFIGSRLVEFLAARGFRLRVLTSNFSHGARIARFPVEFRRWDLIDPRAAADAVQGCTHVFHCAYRFGGSREEQLRNNLAGTRALAEAALAHGVRRFVHTGSVAAYGPPRDGVLDESSPLITGDDYSNTKAALDAYLLEQHRMRGLPVAIVQPTIVYGPFGTTWTSRLLQQVRDFRVVLPRSGQGLCSAVYVDDVVQAMLLAAEQPAAAGRKFLVSGPAPVTWAEFYRSYERMLGFDRLLLLDNASFGRALAEERRRHSLPRRLHSFLARRVELRERVWGAPPFSWAMAASRALLPESWRATVGRRYERLWERAPEPDVCLYFPDEGTARLYAARADVKIDRAQEILGYRPAFDLAAGMRRCEQWARWANLIP